MPVPTLAILVNLAPVPIMHLSMPTANKKAHKSESMMALSAALLRE